MLIITLVTLVALMPVTIMTGQSLPSTVYYLTLLSAFSVLLQHRFANAKDIHQRYRWVLLSLAAPTTVVLFAALWNQQLSGSDLETALRFLLGAWILLLALSHLPRPQLEQSVWGFIIAALAATSYIVYLSWPEWRRPDTGAVYNAVGYGNLTLLLATITLFSIRWNLSPWPRIERVCKILVAVLTLAGFVLTQTRTGWGAVPLFALIGVLLFTTKKHPVRIIIAALAITAVMVTIFATNDRLRQRATDGYTEAMACNNENSTADTSVCIRIQLWRASLDMMAQHPVAGIGDKRVFREHLQKDSLPKGLVSPYVAEGFGEPHNDLMLALATFGIPGGIALLLVYLGPAWLFMRRLAFRHPVPVRTAAAMGLAFCLGFFVFGMAETMFRGMRTASFYAMSIALFMALSDPERYQQESGD